jgi:DNA polymerase III subunit delta'
METDQALNWRIQGHKKQLELLERAMADKRLSHAYVFSGPAQVGKRTIGRRLAQFLLCENKIGCDSCISCRTLAVGSNADYMEISADDAIKIEHVRDLGYKLSLKPYAGNHKIAIVDNAHNMTVEAANALLKVLEEPKPHTLMILITDNSNRLLPTINSRAQKINFGPIDESEFAEWLAAENLAQPDPSFAGRPGYVLNFSKDEDAKTRQSENNSTFQNFVNASLGEKLVMASELAERETPDLKGLLNYWLHHLESRLRENPDEALVKKIRGLMKAQRLLDQNVNSKLLLSELMVATT